MADLRPLFDTLMSDDPQSLIGKEYAISLRIRHASEKFLVFSDAYIQLDQDTRYQVGKWKFETSVVSPYIGKQKMIMLVVIRVDEIHKDDPKMPFFTASILSISEIKEDEKRPSKMM